LWGWGRTELFSYETCIFYTVLTAIPTLDRVSLKEKVVDAPEILTVIDTIPNLSTFLNALYECRYADFFKVGSYPVAIIIIIIITRFSCQEARCVCRRTACKCCQIHTPFQIRRFQFLEPWVSLHSPVVTT
jgi:hypothetical protein